MTSASIIISFYNKTDYLKAVLAGFERQTHKKFEILIADDGSKASVVDEVKKIIAASPLTIKHVWHVDNGWQKNKILNRAIKKSKYAYLIFIDGDCIPHKAFVHEHLINSESNAILAGRRVFLSEKFTNSLKTNQIKNGYLENIFRLFLMKSISWYLGIYLGKFSIKKIILRKKGRHVKGCNMSLYKEALFLINGFDERYVHPTIGEDDDIECRLKNAGFYVKNLKYLAIQYHLHHKLLSREMNHENKKLITVVMKQKTISTPYGLNQEKRINQYL